MKFSVAREALLDVLAAAETITGSKTNFSILSNILIEAKSGKLIISASNNDITMYAEIIAKIEKKGSVTVLEKILAGIIRELPADDILFELTETSMIQIKSLSPKIRGAYEIIGIPKDDFPAIHAFPEDAACLIFDKLQFKKMIKKTIFAVSADNLKYTLNGVYFEKNGNTVKMIGIDGRRLAHIEKEMKSSDLPDFNVIIPQQILSELLKTINGEGPLKFVFHENRLFFKFDNFVFTSTVVSGKFPNYSLFIPKESKFSFTAINSELISAIKRVAVLVDLESHRVKFHLEKNALQISAQNAELGNASTEIFLEFSGEPADLGFSYQYLIEILREIETEEVI
ncbi:MAG TPA: DNA polymerase III subunit beta, partial [Spirochaetia bacterium]|nr:DNA polymerase III subunit beta [Spirochaetia bacterium]